MRKRLFLLMALLVIGTSFNYSFASIIVPSSVNTVIEPDPSKVKAALADLKGLSRKEKRERIKEAKKEMKAFRAEKKQAKNPAPIPCSWLSWLSCCRRWLFICMKA